MSGLQFLFAGFAVVWIVLGIYVVAVARRQSQLRREVEALRLEIVGRREGVDGTGD